MSRWLSSVNNLLNQLDGQVENVASSNTTIPASSEEDIDAILNKRGLSNVETVEDGEDFEEEEEVNFEQSQITEDEEEEILLLQEEEQQTKEDGEEQQSLVKIDKSENEKTQEEDNIQRFYSTKEFDETNDTEQPMKEVVNQIPENSQEIYISESEKNLDKDTIIEVGNEEAIGKEQKPHKLHEEISMKNDDTKEQADSPTSNSSSQSKSAAPKLTQKKDEKKEIADPTISTSSSQSKSTSKQIQKSNEIQTNNDNKKEIKRLHHTIIQLNKELEDSETEMQALRDELERAGVRIEKDRVRYKDEKSQLLQTHQDELNSTKQQHQEAISNLTQQQNTQIQTLMSQIKSLEEGRLKDSGTYEQELATSLEREQHLTKSNFLLEEEKTTLMSQVSMLQAQIQTLQGRLDNLTQTSNASLEREKELEEKMDDMLTLHAKLIQQRQSREAELERTVADLGAALVVAKKIPQNKPNEHNFNDKDMHVQLKMNREELETCKAQLMIESQHCTTLKQEIQDLTRERTEETAMANSKQRQADRKIAELSSTLNKLETENRQLKVFKNEVSNTNGPKDNEKKYQLQIQSMSDQILRQQMKLDLNNSEVSTLQSRLQVALARADTAEQKLNYLNEENDYEKGLVNGGTMRRRNKKGESTESIRSAIQLRNGKREKQIGKAIDYLDNFAVETGRYLRYNPLARGVFIIYLLALHLWVLFILVFHAHSIDTGHGNIKSMHQNQNQFQNVDLIMNNITKLSLRGKK